MTDKFEILKRILFAMIVIIFAVLLDFYIEKKINWVDVLLWGIRILALVIIFIIYKFFISKKN